jgi:hypothetical protein
MDCVICADLERDLDLRRAEYIEALSAPHYRVSSVLAAQQEHRYGACQEHSGRAPVGMCRCRHWTCCQSPKGYEVGCRHRNIWAAVSAPLPVHKGSFGVPFGVLPPISDDRIGLRSNCRFHWCGCKRRFVLSPYRLVHQRGGGTSGGHTGRRMLGDHCT